MKHAKPFRPRPIDTGRPGSATDRTSAIPRALRILIADDHAAVRNGLRALFAVCPGLQVIGEAVNGFEAVAQAHALHPDVVVMDLSMPQMDGVEATRRLSSALPAIEIFGLSAQQVGNHVSPIVAAGGRAHFTKGHECDRLVAALLAVRDRLAGDRPADGGDASGGGSHD